MGLIERLPQQPHHIRLNTTDKEGRTGMLRHHGARWVVTSGNISTGAVPILDIEGPIYTDLRLPFYINGSILGPTQVFRPKTPEGP